MGAQLPRVVVIDDATEVRSLVRTGLQLSRRFTVVAEGASGLDAVALAGVHRPDLLLLDVSMPQMGGLEALPRILEVSPETRVVLYSGFEEQGLAQLGRQLGAAGFIEKSAAVTRLPDQLDALLHTGAPASRPGAAATAAGLGAPAPEAVDEPDLTEHLERFREVFEEAAIGMATMTLTGQLVRVNRALAALVSVPVPDLVGLAYAELVADADPGAVAAAVQAVTERGSDVAQVEHLLSLPTGHRRILATIAAVRDAAGQPLYLFLQAQDVTAQHLAEEQLRQSEERFRLLVETVRDYAIFMLDPQGRVVSWNKGAERIKGYRADEIEGQHFRVFYPPEKQSIGHPERELELAVQNGVYEEEGWRVRKDGSRFWANVVITAIHNGQGELVGFAKVTRDVTERRRLLDDRERAAEALAQSNLELGAANERLARAAADQAQFLAVTAHELRGPVGVLSGSADVLSQHWGDLTDVERTELFESMASSSARLRRLLAELLTASRLEAGALQLQQRPVRVADVVARAVAALRSGQPAAVVEVAPAPPGLQVVADPDRLAQALENLLGNAVLHGAPPVRVQVRGDADTVEVRVSDAGPGVPEELRPRLFDRFASGQHRGTGLGLFIVRELARAHGGDARYEPTAASTPGPVPGADLPPAAAAGPPSGAFVVTLPRARPHPTPGRVTAVAP